MELSNFDEYTNSTEHIGHWYPGSAVGGFLLTNKFGGILTTPKINSRDTKQRSLFFVI